MKLLFNMIPKAITLFYFFEILSLNFCLAQTPVRVVPLEMASIRFEDSYIKVTYSRPNKNDRKIFGELVPYGKIWTPGQNETTEIMLTRDILINQDTLLAGAYSIFVIPNPDQWKVFFNTEVSQWGTYRYNEKFNVLELEVPVDKLKDLCETLTIEFDNRGKKETALVIMWENSQIKLPIIFQDPLK